MPVDLAVSVWLLTGWASFMFGCWLTRCACRAESEMHKRNAANIYRRLCDEAGGQPDDDGADEFVPDDADFWKR